MSFMMQTKCFFFFFKLLGWKKTNILLQHHNKHSVLLRIFFWFTVKPLRARSKVHIFWEGLVYDIPKNLWKPMKFMYLAYGKADVVYDLPKNLWKPMKFMFLAYGKVDVVYDSKDNKFKISEIKKTFWN